MEFRFIRLQWMDGVLAVGLVMVVIGVGWEYRKKMVPATEVELVKDGGEVLDKGGMTPARTIWIDVAGAVEKPGVYQLEEGSRVKDVLVTAGGLAAEADREWVEANLNLARVLLDGEKIVIPARAELTPPVQVLGAKELKININTANMEELDKLPGIGPALAKRIIDYRQQHGGFRDINELKLVSGIGDKLFDKIKDEIGL